MVYRPPVAADSGATTHASSGDAARGESAPVVAAPKVVETSNGRAEAVTSAESAAAVEPVAGSEERIGERAVSADDEDNEDEDDEHGEWTAVGADGGSSLVEDSEVSEESSSDWTTVSGSKTGLRSGASSKPVAELPGWGTEQWATAADVPRLRSKNAVVETSGGSGAGSNGGDADWNGVACLTSDFAMQNVLLHMGLRVSSVEGKRITRIKQVRPI